MCSENGRQSKYHKTAEEQKVLRPVTKERGLPGALVRERQSEDIERFLGRGLNYRSV